jgi:hypothetical protein
MFCLVVKAEEINALYTKSPLTVVDNKITLKLYVNTEHDISGAIFPWSFDQNKLKLVSVKSSNFNVTYKDLNNNLTRNIVLDSANDYNGEVELVEIVFEPTSEFNESDIASIRFGSGQIASYKKSSNITGLEFKALKEEEKIEMTYSVVPIVTTLENSGKDGSLALLDSGTSSKAKKKTGAIKAEKTGIGVPGYAIILLLGGIVITRKNKSIMYRV